jgi:hypothetical protein
MPAAEEYSARRNLAKPADDMKWLTEQKLKVDAAAVQEFLKEQKKGEFQ